MRTMSIVTILSAMALAAPAAAQTAAPSSPSSSAAPATAVKTDTATYQMKPGQWRSSKLVGVDVYNASNESIGEIEEVVLSRDGKIEAVVVGVGGFLGMGEHDVALKYDQVKFVDGPRGSQAPAAAKPGASAPATSTGAAPVNPGSTADGTRGTTTAAGEPYRGYPDHAVVDRSRDQLKALPEVRWES